MGDSGKSANRIHFSTSTSYLGLFFIFLFFFVAVYVGSILVSPEKASLPVPESDERPPVAAKYQSPLQEKHGEGLPNPQSVSPAKQDISLMGTIMGYKEDMGYAVFMDSTCRQEIFSIGANVFNLGILRVVEKDRAYISIEGNTIEFPLVHSITEEEKVCAPANVVNKADKQSSQPFVEPLPPREFARSDEILPVQYVMISTPFIKSMDEHTFLIDRDWLQNELKDQKSITSAKLQPNFIDSKQQGVVIQEIKEDDLYSNLGLLEGDVLTKINEQDISDYKDLPKEFTDFALNKTGEVRLHLLRNGTDVTLTYQGTTVSTEK